MKSSLDRTKVVLRHLPHNISQSALMEQYDARFSGRYNWFCFRSCKNSLKIQPYSRAYIDFKQPEDVIEFAEFFNGHVFVNEKGAQFKTIVEYAPSQHAPKKWSKKDGREGTIDKDPQYLEFLELLAKPVENLPSAEIQLERKEAERAGTAKEAPIVTPLMDFVRQKRAAKGGPRRSLPNGKLARRGSGASSSSSSSAALKRGSERRTSTSMYVPRDTGKSRSGKEKSTYVQVQKRDGQQLSEKPVVSSAVSANVILEEGRGSSDIGKKKILLLKGKEKEIPHIPTGLPPHQILSSVKLPHGSRAPKQNHQRDISRRIIRTILINKNTRQNQSEQPNQTPNRGKMDQRPHRPSTVTPLLNDSNGLPAHHDSHSTRNNEKPDRGVWAPLRRSSGPHASDESISSSNSQSTQVPPDSAQGSYKHGSRRGPSHIAKDADGFPNLSDGKPSKRGVSIGYGSHEKQVWIQKSSSGS